MKKILITGANSYIGTSFKKYLEQYPDNYYVEELDVRDDNWREVDFFSFDVVYHVAGIAHKKEVKENKELYFQVNRDLVVDIAKKAKSESIQQFIFMSSMSVYGLNYSNELITKDTKCYPSTYYGKSKYEAELELNKLNDNNFKVCIVRPPMVYGKGAPGNMERLYKAVRKFHIFPTLRNERSSISIEKLCQEIRQYIDEDNQGLYLPQNKQYMCTVDMIRKQMKKENVKVFYLSLFNPIIRKLIGKVGIITKCFGDLKYGR